jgi:hypothetical protein
VLFGFRARPPDGTVDVAAAINDGGRGARGRCRHHRLRGLLVVSEVALATMLLVGAGLLTRSLLHLQDTSTGFNPEGCSSPTRPVARRVRHDRQTQRVRRTAAGSIAHDAGRGGSGHRDRAAVLGGGRRSTSTSPAGRRRVPRSTSSPVCAR